MSENATSAAGFLKAIGILMIVAGVAALLVNIVAVFGMVLIAAAARRSASMLDALGVNAYLLCAGGACLLLNAAAEFVAGVVGCANCKRPEKADVCLKWGVAAAMFCVAGQVAVIAGGGSFNIASVALGLVLPVLFIIVAAKVRRQN